MALVGSVGGLTLTAAKLLFGGADARSSTTLDPLGIGRGRPGTSVLPPGAIPIGATDPSRMTAAEQASASRSSAMKSAMENGELLGRMIVQLDTTLGNPDFMTIEEAKATGSDDEVKLALVRHGMVSRATSQITRILGQPPVLEDVPGGGRRTAAFTYENKVSYGNGNHIDFAASGGGGEKVRYTLLDSQSKLHWTYQYNGDAFESRSSLLYSNA